MGTVRNEPNNNLTAAQASQNRKLVYRGLLNKIEDIQESEQLGLNTVVEIGNIIKEVTGMENENDISERYQYPAETVLDSMVISSASDVLVKCLEAVDITTTQYIPLEFADRIKDYCKADEDEEFDSNNLLKLLADAQRIIPQIPDYNFVYGTYDLQNLPQPKQRKERVKQVKERFEKKVPEKVTNLEKEEQGIDEIVKELYDVLSEAYERNSQQPIKYYDYVIDTSSFSKTVENMFNCSFLIRDGRAHLDLDNKGNPLIKPMKKRQLKQFRDEGGVNSQIISVITVNQWESFKKEGYLQKYRKRQN